METDDTNLKAYITEDLHFTPEIVSGIHSMDREVRLAATVKVRSLLQKWPEEGAQPVINSGLLETVVEMLSSDDLKFRAEAAWILTKVASGTPEHTAAVVAAGAIPKLVALFSCESTEAMDNGLWALSNIGGDSERLRDLVVQEGAVKPLLDVLDTPEKYPPKMVETASWALTNYLNQNRDEGLGYEVTRHMIPVLTKFIKNSTGKPLETFTNVLKALDYISADDAAAEAILATGIAPRLVELCTAKADDVDVRYHAIRCVGKFTSGSEASTEATIQAGLLLALKFCIQSEHVGTRQYACWTASNIAAGSLSQAQTLFDNDLMPLILRVISNREEEMKPSHEASWVLYTLVNKGQEHHDLLVRLVQASCMEAFASGLSSSDYSTLSILIHGLELVADKQWSGQQDALERFKVAGGVGRLVALRDEPETRRTFVGRTALGLLRTYFQEFVKRPRV